MHTYNIFYFFCQYFHLLFIQFLLYFLIKR
nr:MAG TPA: hypothetical protein [Caudoviricetes sp.]